MMSSMLKRSEGEHPGYDRSGELQPAAMITDVVTLAQLPAAFEALRDPVDQCKVLVDLRPQ